MIKFISRLLPVSEHDFKFINKNENYLVVGKDDRQIGVVEKGELTILTEKASMSETGTEGYLKIPLDNSLYFIIQWGRANVGADAETTVNFQYPFPNKCLQVVGNIEENDPIDTLFIKKDTKEKFIVKVVGGSGKEIVTWLAIGY